MTSLISSLVDRPFLTRPVNEQAAIVLNGPPPFRLQPPLDDAQEDPSSSNTRAVAESIYEQHEWLTGCEVQRRCFCWPCLLYAKDRDGTWTGKSGGLKCDSGSPPAHLHAHRTTLDHIEADLRLKMARHRLREEERGAEERRLGEDAGRRREGLEALVDVICGDVVLDPLLRGERGGRGPGNARRYADLLRESRDYLRGDCEGREQAAELVGQAPRMVDFAIKAMATAVKEEIWREAAGSTYVSIVLNEHFDEGGGRIVSAVLRFVRGDEPCERFVGFRDGLPPRAEAAVGHVADVLQQFGVRQKLAAFAVDGGVLPAEELARLVQLMQLSFPRAYFSHWHAHQFGDLLLQGLAEVPPCDEFSRALRSLHRFFLHKSKLLMVFEGLLKFKQPEEPPFEVSCLWGGPDDLVSLTLRHRPTLLEFFRYVVQKPGQFRAGEVVLASGFRRHLSEPRTVFLLCLLSALSCAVHEFGELLRVPRRVLEGKRAGKLAGVFERFRLSQFPAVCLAAGKELRRPWAASAEFEDLFDLVLDRLVLQLRVRVESWRKLRFCLLLQRVNWRLDALNRNSQFWQLLELLEKHFGDSEAISGEFLRINRCRFVYPCSCFTALFKVFVSVGARESLPNLFRLAELCLTLPLQPLQSASPSMLDVIQDWASCSDEEADRARALLGVESKLLLHLKDTNALKKLTQVFE